MPRYLSGEVTAILAEREGFQRVEVGERRAYVLTDLIGAVAVGDEVLLNVTATDLDLGTGGWDVVHWNLSRREWHRPGGGHIMKLRYTSLQADTGAAEEHDPGEVDLTGFPVLATFLHSQLAPAAAAFAKSAPGRRLAWVMTDSAALPLALSDLAVDLVAKDLVHQTISTGQAFGGQIEAVNLVSGLEAARRAGCDAAVVGPGPGVVGTGTQHGFSGLEVASIIDSGGAVGADVVVALRWSDADPRPRHRGLSHHTRTALSLTSRRATVAVATEYPVDGLPGHFDLQTVDCDPAGELAQFGLTGRSMGRGVTEDPGFFAMASAAGHVLANRVMAPQRGAPRVARMNRLERLINLLAALIDTERPLPRDEIKERIHGYPPRDDSFRRQFERDKETLRAMGVPIAVEAISDSEPHLGTGYRVRRADYELPDPGLEPDETAALHLAATSVRFLDEGARAAVLKLGGVVGAGADPPAADVEVPGGEHLETLFAAIHDSRRVTFTYAGGFDKAQEDRQVVPARLAFRNGNWYLSAWDEGRAGERVFRLDRIAGDISAGEVATLPPEAAGARPSALPAAAWELGEGEPVEARVWVDQEQAELAARLAGEDVGVERQEDGSAVLTFGVRNPVGFRNFVLGFLDHAEVLSPPELRDDMISWLEGVSR